VDDYDKQIDLYGVSNTFIRFWNADNGELMQTLENTGGLSEWSADGKLFLTSTEDFKAVNVWDVAGPELETTSVHN
jgi:WD40 repeat protein